MYRPWKQSGYVCVTLKGQLLGREDHCVCPVCFQCDSTSCALALNKAHIPTPRAEHMVGQAGRLPSTLVVHPFPLPFKFSKIRLSISQGFEIFIWPKSRQINFSPCKNLKDMYFHFQLLNSY